MFPPNSENYLDSLECFIENVSCYGISASLVVVFPANLRNNASSGHTFSWHDFQNAFQGYCGVFIKIFQFDRFNSPWIQGNIISWWELHILPHTESDLVQRWTSNRFTLKCLHELSIQCVKLLFRPSEEGGGRVEEGGGGQSCLPQAKLSTILKRF